MRKLWIVLLSLGLLAALSLPTFAASGADIKISGQYLINGFYSSNPSLKQDSYAGAGSYGVFDQRLRMQMDLKVAEGLSLVTRFDALEKIWGAKSGTEAFDSTSRLYSTTAYEQENIEFERAYVDFTTGIGRFMVGYQQFTFWGTPIADGNNTKPGIKYIVASGPSILVLALERNQEGQVRSGIKTYDFLDSDTDIYDVGLIHKWKGGEAGIMYQYAQLKNNRPSPPTGGAYQGTLHIVDPYIKQTMGPLYVEAEMIWLTGKLAKFEPPVSALAEDIDAKDFGLYIKANYDLKPAYVGGIFLYVQGDDYDSLTKQNGGWIKAMSAATNVFEPCLLFGSYWYNHAVGGQTGFVTSTTSPVTGTAMGSNNYTYFFDNIWMLQGYAGFKPIPKLDLMMSYSWFRADQLPRAIKGVPVSAGNPEFQSKDIGTELDIKATYKIFDNLSYMVGAAYFWTGDYFKGTSATNQVDDNYLLMHSLNLTF
jgi:hypothetical protein